MTDLDALADRLDRNSTDRGGCWCEFCGQHHGDEYDLRTAARILRAVAAAPGPLRDAVIESGHCDWCDWLDTLADAVGEP